MGANGNLIHIAEHIQLCKSNRRCRLNLNTVPCRHNVHGANPAGTPRFGTVLSACLAKGFGFSAEHFAHKRAFAHTGGIGLYHADHIINPGTG